MFKVVISAGSGITPENPIDLPVSAQTRRALK
jgi:hypothetical protein